jgi:DNA replication protein DnaD
MANPQPTDAHLRIAHSIEEQIIVSMFSERQLRILLFILRLSWGCNKHSAYIPKQKDFEICGVLEGHVKPLLNSLILAQVIIREGDYYQFNKDFDRWRVSLARDYSPEKLTELVSLNLNEPDKDLRKLTESVSSDNITTEKLTESVSPNDENLPKREVSTYQKGKFVVPELASPKETTKEIYSSSSKNITLTTEQIASVARTYEKEIGPITQFISEELNDACRNYSYDEIIYAFKQASLQQHRSWKYVAGILSKRSGHNSGGNGQKQGYDQNVVSDPDEMQRVFSARKKANDRNQDS